MIMHPYVETNEANHLTVSGLDAEVLAKTYGTPLYVYSEDAIMSKMRQYVQAMAHHAPGGQVAYASKAYLTLRMAHLVNAAGLWIDVASAGELYIATQGGIPAGHVIFHGNNKTPDEIALAVSMGVGRIVADSPSDLERIESVAKAQFRVQQIMLRLTPGIDPDTHRYLATGEVDSKFGIPIEGDKAMDVALQASESPNLILAGFHCHIGSQIFQAEPFRMAAKTMIQFISSLRERGGIAVGELDLGGGLGVPYRNEKELPVDHYVREISKQMRVTAETERVPTPRLILEPGRSIVAQAGVTLYTVGTVKDLPDGTRVAAVDGGMSDNPRPMLYDARYEALSVSNARCAQLHPYRIVGKHCEEGDTLIQRIMLPRLHPGDILATLVSGAYQYSMSSNYNGALRPAVIHVRDRQLFVAVQRQTLSDLIRGQLRESWHHDLGKAADESG